MEKFTKFSLYYCLVMIMSNNEMDFFCSKICWTDRFQGSVFSKLLGVHQISLANIYSYYCRQRKQFIDIITPNLLWLIKYFQFYLCWKDINLWIHFFCFEKLLILDKIPSSYLVTMSMVNIITIDHHFIMILRFLI